MGWGDGWRVGLGNTVLITAVSSGKADNHDAFARPAWHLKIVCRKALTASATKGELFFAGVCVCLHFGGRFKGKPKEHTQTNAFLEERKPRSCERLPCFIFRQGHGQRDKVSGHASESWLASGDGSQTSRLLVHCTLQTRFPCSRKRILALFLVAGAGWLPLKAPLTRDWVEKLCSQSL